MHRLVYTITMSLLLLLRFFQQGTPAPAIISPSAGQVLQGVVPIVVTTNLDGFQSAELSFAYLEDTTDTWFILIESDVPIDNDVLAEWDTSTISDSNYTLRLVVRLNDGNELSTQVEGIRVRNYTAVEADTPTPTIPTPTPQASETLVPTPTPTITPMPTSTLVPATSTAPPPNPAELSRQAVLTSIGWGILIVIVGLAIFGLYRGLLVRLGRN
jgi:hypothetical protein